MHTMEKTPKIVTTIGLVFEGLGVLGAIGGIIMMSVFLNNMTLIFGSELTADEMVMMEGMFMILRGVMIGIAVLTTVVFVVNFVLFGKLIRGKHTEETAQKVYTYQLIWAIICLFFNQIVGVLYLVSALLKDSEKKKAKMKEMT